MTDNPDHPSKKNLPANNPLPDMPDKPLAKLGEAFKEAGLDISDPKFSRVLEMTVMSVSGSSSLPPAILLEQWEPLYPGITAKFVGWTEKQAAHRQAIERQRADRSEDRQDRGQLLAAGIAALGLVLAAMIVIFGSGLAAVVVGSVCAIIGVGGVAAATIAATRISLPSIPTTKAPKKVPKER